MTIDMKSVTSIDQLTGEDELDAELLREMARNAKEYLESFDWCPPIAEGFFGCGVGGILAVFLFRLAAKIGDSDDRLWVVVGDVPSAYLVTEHATDPPSALSVYCDLMDQWTRAVVRGSPLDDVFPVAAHPTLENATTLTSRTKFIREEIIPKCEGSRDSAGQKTWPSGPS
ncbi:MAG TPA: hypothetical protein VHY91_18235 [Pirellulales bacterium]|jgi:hypothetical protein|nr:hypothetical protein [Pirellulales bacterium]